MKYVNHATDIFSKYGDLMAAAYDKANIWPLGDARYGKVILAEEVEESFSAVNALYDHHSDIICKNDLSAKAIGDCRAYALNAIFELLQVIAVCNKYQDVFEMEVER